MSSSSEDENIELKVGDTFASVQGAKDAVNWFKQQIDTNNKTSLVYHCNHGGRVRGSKSKGERPKQHYNNLGCKAMISFYKSKKDGSLTCKAVNNEHNHEVSAKVFNFENSTLNLKSGNCKPSQIKRVLNEKFQKDLTLQNLKNVLRNISDNNTEDLDRESINFAEFFSDLEDKGGNVDWEEDPD